MRKRLDRLGEVRIVDETNGFGLDCVNKTESGFWSTTPDLGALIMMGFSGLAISLSCPL